MKEITKPYLKKKIYQLNKKIHRAEDQNDENKVWWRKMKLFLLEFMPTQDLTQELNHLKKQESG